MMRNPVDTLDRIESRLANLEGQCARWRLAALAVAGLMLVGGAMAFRYPLQAAPLEGTSLVLRDAAGHRVELVLSPAGALQVRFGAARNTKPTGREVTELVLFDAQGQRVARLGSPSAQHLQQ